jgi:hypothetical protein
MTAPSVRDRFWTRPVARALTSPSAIVATGLGAAVGIVATAPLSVPLAVVGGLVGGALGLGGRLAAAMPRKPKAVDARIDPMQVAEPWRHAVVDALQAKGRYQQAVASFRDGPIKVSAAGIGVQVDNAVAACWEIAQQGDRIATARGRLRDRDARGDLERLRGQIGAGSPTENQQRTMTSLQNQIAAADRLDQLLVTTDQELDLLNARLDESVTNVIELSVANSPVADAASLGRDLDAIVDDLESLRAAIAAVDTPPSTGLATATG